MLEKPIPRLLKTRTVLVKIELVVDYYDRFGDPALVVKPNTIHSISNTTAPGVWNALGSPVSGLA